MALTFEQLVRMDLVKAQAELAAKWVADKFHDRIGPLLSSRCIDGQPGYDSPIEAVFEFWWDALLTLDSFRNRLELVPQKVVELEGKQYRLDFAIEHAFMASLEFPGAVWPLVCVELDGHDFHERTKAQVTYRNARDRALQSAGWLVLHYSGSELVKDPAECVEDCWQKADEAFWKVKNPLIDQQVAEWQARRALEQEA